MSKRRLVSMDDDLNSADWTKTTWDLPPYKSADFFQVIPFSMLDDFRTWPVYKAAEAACLICDDEWVDDSISSYTPPAKVAKADVDDAANQAHTTTLNPLLKPSQAQLKAGNYKMGHTTIAGLDITIENPAGSHRRPNWPAMTAHYGYVKRTVGADGDHVDVFVRPGSAPDYNGPVFVIDQYVAGSWDEHKVMLGWPTEQAASAAYLSNYQPGWGGLGSITQMTVEEFKDWLDHGDTTTPVASHN